MGTDLSSLNATGGTRRTFVKLLGAISSFVMLVKCKTFGTATTLKEGDTEAINDFSNLSKTLTGFDELEPTLANQYLADLRAQFGDGPVQAMIATYKTLELEGGDLEAQIQSQIMEQEALSGVAGAAMMLWYGGNFAKLQVQQPVAVKAYQQSLVWKTFGGKPMGIPGDDLAVWANAPE